MFFASTTGQSYETGARPWTVGVSKKKKALRKFKSKSAKKSPVLRFFGSAELADLPRRARQAVPICPDTPKLVAIVDCELSRASSCPFRFCESCESCVANCTSYHRVCISCDSRHVSICSEQAEACRGRRNLASSGTCTPAPLHCDPILGLQSWTPPQPQSSLHLDPSGIDLLRSVAPTKHYRPPPIHPLQ